MNSVYIEITDVCNLRCSFCPCSQPANRRTFMPSELFEKCLAGAVEIGADNVFFHVLGEPTLHPEFAHYLKKLEETPLKLTLTTNGTTIARTGKHILQSPAVRQVNFSTHAYAELAPEEAESHLQNALDFCRLALASRPDLYLNLRLWNVGDPSSAPWNERLLTRVNETFHTNVEPGHFCSRHKSFNVTGRLYLHEDTRFEWPKNKVDSKQWLVRSDNNGAARSALKYSNETTDERGDGFGEGRNIEPFSSVIASLSGRGNPRDEKKAYKQEIVKGTCHALDTHVAILHDGRVVACCLDHSGQIALGNIQAQSLPEILESPLATQLRDGFAKHELRHPFCQNCSYCKRFK